MMKNTKTKRVFSAILSVALIITLLTSMWIYSASAETATGPAAVAELPDPGFAGEGTEASPYQITDKADLEAMRDRINNAEEKYVNAYYELTDDIQLSGSENWNPIGRGSTGISSSYAFNGTFDGKGHTISGLYFKSNSNYYAFGLFGYNAGTIKNLSVEGCDITGYFWNGIIAGINYGTIENCFTSGSLIGAFANGGFVGINRGGTIKNCFTAFVSTGYDSTDGIYGSNYDRVDSGNTTAAVIENNYYLDDIAGINVAGKVEPVSQADLASGKVAWLLQNGVDGEELVWEQNIGTDALPGLHKADDGDRSNAVHQALFYFYNTDTVIADIYVNENTITAPDATTVDIDGYTVGDKWFTDKDKVDGDDDAWDFASAKVTKDTEFYSSKKAIEYTITYNLGDGGSWGEKEGDETGHPSKYTVEDSVEILDEPIRKDGYKFIGWTGTGITGSAESVVIETGSTGNREYTAQYYDSENPVATITVGGDSWKYPATAIEFDTFFNTSQTVTITAEDNEDPNVDLWYYIANEPVDDVESINWIPYDSENKPVIDPEGQYVIYAKAADDEGNIGYTNTSGIVLEVTAPVISGLTNGTTYCLSANFTVTDANLETVTANGSALTAAEDGTYTITAYDTYTITATDKAGNATSFEITVSDHVDGETATELVREVGCINDGLEFVRTYCANCKALIKTEEKITSALDHAWGEWETVKTAGCEDDGVKQHTCSRCNLTVSENVSHSGHQWSAEKEVLREATCVQEGEKAYVCQKCDATYDEEIIEKLPHQNDIVTEENIVPATCTQNGSYETVSRCSVCKQETSRVPGVLLSAGHQWTDYVTVETPNCTDSGTLQRECTVCKITESKNVDPNGHTWEETPSVDRKATCTVDGSQSIHCTVCGVSKPESSEVIKATGHTPAEQKLIKNYEPATCTQNGSYEEVTVCTVCNEEIATEYKTEPMKEHDWCDWYAFTSGVCGGDAGERRDCKTCQLSETRNINKLEHDWNDDYTVDLEPTCTTQGSQSIHCKRSGCVAILKSETIDPLGHNWSDWSVVVSPDCDDAGTEMHTCSRCNASETQGLNPNGHAWNVDENGEYVYTVDAAASCTTDGSESVHCKNCDAKINSKTIPSYGHTFGEWTVTDSPECEDEGTAQRECKECGFTESENIEATGHTWADAPTIDKKPTCTEDGSQSIHCTKCDAKKDSAAIPMLGHDWSDWSVAESPACEAQGTEMRTCSRCDATETRGIDPTGHDWNVDENGEYIYTVDVAASCTADGSESVHCKNCDAKINSKPIPAYGHTFGDWTVTKAPKCEEEGTAQRKCKECGFTESKSIEATGHVWADAPTVDKEPTCTEEGSQSIHCTKCDAKKDITAVPMTDHDFVNGICDRCGANDGTAAQPEILLAGTDNEYTIGSKGGASIHCDGELRWFVSVSIDGNIVPSDCYTLSEGSTIITFTSAFLDTLSVGKHNVTLTFTYGEASGILTVVKEDESTTEPTTEPVTDEPTTEPATDESTTQAPEATKPAGNNNSTSPNTGSTRYILGASGAILFAAAGLALASKKRKEDEE